MACIRRCAGLGRLYFCGFRCPHAAGRALVHGRRPCRIGGGPGRGRGGDTAMKAPGQAGTEGSGPGSTTGLVLAADDKYALPLAVTGRSLLENISNRDRLTWYVLDLGLSARSRELIRQSWFEVPGVQFLTLDADDLAGIPSSRGPG